MLETSKGIPAVPLKLRPKAAPSDSNKSYPCNGGTREHLAKTLDTPAQKWWVLWMHLTAFHLPAALWKDTVPDRLRHSLFNIDDTLSCLWEKVKCFYNEDFRIFMGYFCQVVQCRKNPVINELTNRLVCDLMTSVHKTKTLTENLLLPGSYREPAVGASRSRQHQQSDSRVGSVNELAFSNGTRLPPLKG